MNEEKFVEELDTDFKDRWNMLPMYYGIHHDFKLFVYFMIVDYWGVKMKIPHIKLFRMIFRSGLKEAKEAVEWMAENKYLAIEDQKDELPPIGIGGIGSRAADYITAYELYREEDYNEFMIPLAKGLLMRDWTDTSMYPGYRHGGYEWFVKNIFPEDWENDKTS